MEAKQRLEVNSTSANPNVLVGSSSNPSGDTASFVLKEGKDSGAQAEAIDSAVYSYLQSLRALGRTRINTVDIAIALDIRESDVSKSVARLRGRGVKIAA